MEKNYGGELQSLVPPLAELSAQDATYFAGISAGFYDKEKAFGNLSWKQYNPAMIAERRDKNGIRLRDSQCGLFEGSVKYFLAVCNEGELLERFNIQLSPIPLPELTT